MVGLKSGRTHVRLKKRFGRHVAVAAGGVLLILIIVMAFVMVSSNRHPYESIVIAADPFLVFYREYQTGRTVLLTLPADTKITLTRQYGEYTLDAAWRLAIMEKKPMLLRESLEEALGIPVRWYIGRSDGRLLTGDESRTLFSIPNVAGNIYSVHLTNMPFITLWQIARAYGSINPVRTRNIEITNDQLSLETLPDGSRVYALDSESVDRIYQHAFDMSQVRDEKLRVTVINTTDTPGLGQRAGRLMANLGIAVVRVNSEVSGQQSCSILSAKPLQTSHTVRVLADIYGCNWEESQSTDGADIIIRMGKAFEKRFKTDLL